MAKTTDLQIVRIPYDGSPKQLTTIPLVDVGPGGMSADECKDIEKELEHIPDIKSPASSSSSSFSWTHRRLLIGQSFTSAASESWSAVYLIYMSRESGAGLAPNGYLNELMRDLDQKGRMTAMEEFEAYGDAFVFRMKAKTKKGSGEEGTRAEYVDMPGEFVSDGMADVILRRLLMYPWDGE